MACNLQTTGACAKQAPSGEKQNAKATDHPKWNGCFSDGGIDALAARSIHAGKPVPSASRSARAAERGSKISVLVVGRGKTREPPGDDARSDGVGESPWAVH